MHAAVWQQLGFIINADYFGIEAGVNYNMFLTDEVGLCLIRGLLSTNPEFRISPPFVGAFC